MPHQDKKLKILVISSTYPLNPEDAVSVPWMRETHRRLKENGHDVTVLAPAFKGKPAHEIDDIEVVRFRYAPKFLETLTHEQGASYKIRSRYKQLLAIPYVLAGCIVAAWLAFTRRFDVVHVHWPFPHGIMGQIASFIGRCPLIAMSHGAELALARKKPWIRPLLRNALRAADLRVSNSTDTGQRVTELSRRECKVLPYGTTVRPPANNNHDEIVPRVLFTGRLIERKGLEYLLHAAQKITATHSVKFIITGDGDQRARLEELQNELGLQKAVSFRGFVSKQELQREYSRCSMWVNPGIVDSWGDAEGLGIGSIEAYNFCKPVIASAVGGIPDTVAHGHTGYLVPQKDVGALADAIVDLLDDQEKAKEFGNNGYAFVQRKFSWTRIIRKTEELYREAIDRFNDRRSILSAQASKPAGELPGSSSL